MGFHTTAILLLGYSHAPAITSSFVGTLVFGLWTLQKQTTLGVRERYVCLCLMLALVASYLIQGIYYLSLTESTPQHSGIHVYSSIIAWGLLTTSILTSKSIPWQSYLSAFIIQVLFETGFCVLSSISISTRDQVSSVPLTLGALRVLLSLLLMAHWILLGRRRCRENGVESQPLLSNGRGHDSPDQSAAEDGAEDDDIKEQQRKGLEQDGLVGYIKGFVVFLPYLWPRDDPMIKKCVGIQVAHLILIRILNPLTPQQFGRIIDGLVANTFPWKNFALWVFCKWLGGGTGVSVLSHFASEYISNYANMRIKDLAFRHLVELGLDFHSNRDSSEVSRAVEQAGSLTDLVEIVIFVIPPVLVDLVVAMWVVTNLFDMYMAYTILLVGIIYAWIGISATTWTKPKRKLHNENIRHQNKAILEPIRNWETVTYWNRGEFERAQYQIAIQATITARFAYFFRFYVGYITQDWIAMLGFAGCCLYAMVLIISKGMPVGNLITLHGYWGTLTNPLSSMANSYKSISLALTDAERLLQILNTKPSVTDTKISRELSDTSRCRIEFKNVSFAYDSEPILEDISFTVEPGKMVAIVGESGGGKTTILKLIFRLYDVTSGSILIDGEDIRSFTISSLRSAIGMIPQKPTLFNRSILETLRYARPDATAEEVKQACKAASIHDKIESLPQKYDSKTGEQGNKLSGGEIQRIVVAQVLLRNPRVLLLDECTSGLDPILDAGIQEAFRRLKSTKLAIAHRISTVADADEILVIQDGRIVERGTHSYLIRHGHKYPELWAKQTEIPESATILG